MRRGLAAAWLVLFATVLVGSAAIPIPVPLGSAAPDFPPGEWTDGRSLHRGDLAGKVVVLFFFEKQCPRCWASFPEANLIVRVYQGKPIKFIAVSPGSTLAEATTVQQTMQLTMPIFTDHLRLLEKRYGFTISLNNICQVRIISPDGKIVGMDMNRDTLDKALADGKARWKYRDRGYDSRLGPALDALEWGDYAQGARQLALARQTFIKVLADSANELSDKLKKEGQAWKAEGDQCAETAPMKAYDAYARVARVFAGDELGKSVAGPLQKLAANPAVRRELAARKAFASLESALANTAPAQTPLAIKALQDFAKKYPNTPTSNQAADLARELGE